MRRTDVLPRNTMNRGITKRRNSTNRNLIHPGLVFMLRLILTARSIRICVSFLASVLTCMFIGVTSSANTSFYCLIFHSASSSDSSPKSGQSPASQSPHHQGASPVKKQHKLNLDLGARAWNAIGERIDPSVPLEQQGYASFKILFIYHTHDMFRYGPFLSCKI